MSMTFRLETMVLTQLTLITLLVVWVNGLHVDIDYSFYLPKELGQATPKRDTCCPYGILPTNATTSMHQPSFICIGVQQGGVEVLYEQLRQHPKLQGTVSDMHYLEATGNLSYDKYLRSWKWNKNEEEAFPEGGQMFEMSPSAMFVPFAACKAKIVMPDAKFVVLLRDPTDRAYSGVLYTTITTQYKDKKFLPTRFWDIMFNGMRELGSTPQCDFQTGKGIHTYNDCVGCMVRMSQYKSRCHLRPFVTLRGKRGNFTCDYPGKEHVLRGMYAVQLAWWFTFFHPSQFLIINSADYYKRPLDVLRAIGTFLKLEPAYERDILESAAKRNFTSRRFQNQKMVDFAKKVLKEFYKRPNLELYRLLHETGHIEFTPFEAEFQNLTSINCSDPEVLKAKTCGDPRFHEKLPELICDMDGCLLSVCVRRERLEDGELALPSWVSKTVRPFYPERPKEDAEALMKQIAKQQEQVRAMKNSSNPSTIDAIWNTAKDPAPDLTFKSETVKTTERDANKQDDHDQVDAPGPFPEEQDNALSTMDFLPLAPNETQSTDQEEPQPTVQEEISDVPDTPLTVDVPESSSEQEQQLPSHPDGISELQWPTSNNEKVTEQNVVHDEPYQNAYHLYSESGVNNADYFVHFLFGVILVGFFVYGYRCTR